MFKQIKQEKLSLLLKSDERSEGRLKKRVFFEIPPARSGWHRPRFRAGRPSPYIDAIHLQKVISKINPAPFEQQRVSVPIEEKEQKCLSVCAIRCRECVKRVLLFPRLERQTQAANERRTRHIRRISEQRSEWLAKPVCRALWFFHAMKERRRRTTNRIYDKRNKVKNCLRIQGWQTQPLRLQSTCKR